MMFFLIFVAVPIIEIGLFIQVGGWLGLWPTLAIVILTAFLGTTLLRMQGMAAMARLQESLNRGGNPVDPIVHGALILAAGILLLTPGFFTDAAGLALLVPVVRTAVIRWGAARMIGRGTVIYSGRSTGGPGRRRRPPHDPGAVDGEYVVIDDDAQAATHDDGPPPQANRRPRPPSGWTRDG